MNHQQQDMPFRFQSQQCGAQRYMLVDPEGFGRLPNTPLGRPFLADFRRLVERSTTTNGAAVGGAIVEAGPAHDTELNS